MDQNNTTQASGEEQNNGKEITNMASLLNEEGLGLELPEVGNIKTGTIASISPGQIMVSIGSKSEGIVSGQEFELIPPDVFASMEVGQEIAVYVITPEDQHGNLILSYVRAIEAETWKGAEEIMKSKSTFTGKVVSFNRGGLIVAFRELQGFVPSSLLSFGRRNEMGGETADKRFGEMIGSDITLQIIEVDQENRRLIFSEKAAVHETRDSIRDKVIEKLKVGDVLKGRVTSLADFGAFVNINGADGLVHVSEISWDKIRHPGDVLKVGEEVEVKVISIDEEKRHIGLSIRRMKDDPWQSEIGDMKVGQLVEAKITRLTKFGAFAMLESGIEGLIHISEISEEHIAHPKEVLHEDDKVTLRIIKIEPDSHRIGLSLRRVESLAFANMDMKMLEKELQGTDIKISGEEAEKAQAVTEQETFSEPESGEAKAAAAEQEPVSEPEPGEAEAAAAEQEPVSEPESGEAEAAAAEQEPVSEPEPGEAEAAAAEQEPVSEPEPGEAKAAAAEQEPVSEPESGEAEAPADETPSA